jgi:hypothetical protein
MASTFGHQGLMHDEENGLVYNRHRMLHPRAGRFMQCDPLGYVDGMGYRNGDGPRIGAGEASRKLKQCRVSTWLVIVTIC